ncbi:large-conductance mechanosensitive channel protein MscL, partial [Roseomonas acroporae]
MKAPIPIHGPAWLNEFKAFVLRGNVVDLAVGIIIGAAFTAIVSSLVEDIFNPLLGLLIGGIDFSNWFITLKGEHAATLAEARRVGAVTLNVGVFLNAIIKFVIVAFAVFWVVKTLSKLYVKEEKVTGPSLTETLLTEIRDELRDGPARLAAPAGLPTGPAAGPAPGP